MECRFSDLAEAGLRNVLPDPEIRAAFQAAVAWKLSRDPGFQSRPCDAFPTRPLRVARLFAGADRRILYEVGTTVVVWSVGRVPAEVSEGPVTE
jgi:hypothetical protein